MFRIHQTNYQTKHLAKNWQKILQKREVMRNNYRVTGDIKQAKAFVSTVMNYSPHAHFASHGEHVIFSTEMLLDPLSPAYIVA